MPNVVVYLLARDHAALIEEGHDPAYWVRETVKRALSEREGNPGSTPGRAGDVSPGRPAAKDTSRSESDTFKPDPKPQAAEKKPKRR